MNKILVLVRGLPGSGKSTFCNLIADARTAADDFPGLYDGGFHPELLPQAHRFCQRTTRGHLVLTAPNRRIIAVDNTFSQRWEMEPYLQMTKELGVRVNVVDLYDGGLDDAALVARNTHGVPLGGIQAMRARWEHDWKVGNPLPPPWLR